MTRELLADHERQLWADYERLDQAGLRQQALASLREFIDAIRNYSPEHRRAWVEATCARHWSGAGFPWIEGLLTLRYPLLVEVIFPDLLVGYREQRPNYARWLALFSLGSSGDIDAQPYDELRLRGLPEWYPPELLREALVLDPSDEQAAHALICYFENRFDYWTHHVPDGVLTDDTETWRRELAEFEQLIEHYPTERDYSFEVRGWRLHCDAWEEYLECKDEFGSYADFLAQRDA